MMVDIDRDVYLENPSIREGKGGKGVAAAGSTTDFFTKEVIKNLSAVSSKADKTFVDSIVAKYEKEFGAQKNTFAASK